MECIRVPASIDQLDTVQEFIEEKLEGCQCPDNIIMMVSVAVEEIFVNIAHYAYAPGKGEAEICCEVRDDPQQVVVQFQDCGTPFDPLEKEEAATTQEALLEREGGLGILMVRKSMDSMSYSFENGKNILTISKKLGSGPKDGTGESHPEERGY